MEFEEAMRDAAKAADTAVRRAIRKYRAGLVTDEDDLTGVLLGHLDSEFDKAIGGLSWSSSILRHRKGKAAEESAIGADMVIHVRLRTQAQRYSKAVLIQAKRQEPGTKMRQGDFNDLVSQCNKMLDVTPSSFVFDYAKKGLRCGSASKIAGTSDRDLYNVCNWTPYRFFLELFRCPIGDPRITSAKVSQLPVPSVLTLTGEGELQVSL